MVRKMSSFDKEGSVNRSHRLDRKRKHEEFEFQKLELEKLELQKLAIENGAKLMETYEAVCSSTTVDDHARLIFKDYFLNIAAQFAGLPLKNDPITTSMVAWGLDYFPTDSQVREINKIIRRRYEKIYARSPPQTIDAYDEVTDAFTHTDSYTERDRPMMERIIKDFMVAQESEDEDSD